MEPLPLGVPIPVTIAVPRHLASNGDGFVFLIEATCELYTPVAAAHVRDVIVATAQQAAKAEMVQGGWKYESINQGLDQGLGDEAICRTCHGKDGVLYNILRGQLDDRRLHKVFRHHRAA
ncbi:uncharacterized protein [Miscanthus floridulus]|uniref:uncharacterized protein n=1 Tax=Miscanthus floridulus TaxID=154761 RepID=UPI003459D206